MTKERTAKSSSYANTPHRGSGGRHEDLESNSEPKHLANQKPNFFLTRHQDRARNVFSTVKKKI